MSWFEPLAGITSDHHGSGKAPLVDRGPWRCAGVTNHWWDVGPIEPAIRERACPGPGLNLGSDPRHEQEEQDLEGVLWYRLGRGPSRRRPGRWRGKLIAKRRISDDAAGFAVLIMLLADAGDSVDDPIPVAIETSRGLLVACLRATGRRVYAINPMAVFRYRDRHSVARKKSDAGDALVLANILRTDMAAHRLCPLIPNSSKPSPCSPGRNKTPVPLQNPTYAG